MEGFGDGFVARIMPAAATAVGKDNGAPGFVWDGQGAVNYRISRLDANGVFERVKFSRHGLSQVDAGAERLRALKKCKRCAERGWRVMSRTICRMRSSWRNRAERQKRDFRRAKVAKRGQGARAPADVHD